MWGVIRSTDFHTEVRKLVYNTLWDMENWSIQSTLLAQPLIVLSTPPIQSTPPAQYLPIQQTSLFQATPPILQPPVQSVPSIEPALFVQTLLIKSGPLPVQPILSVVEPTLSFQTVRRALPALLPVEPVPLASPVFVPCASAAFQFILPTYESVLPATIESDPPTCMDSIIQEASKMQVLTE